MTKEQKKDVLMMSYRPISGYSSKSYKVKSGGKLIILSGEEESFDCPSTKGSRHAQESVVYVHARELMEKIRTEALQHLGSPQFRRVIIYSGLYAQREALEFARYVKETIGIIPELVVCRCDIDKKKEFAKDLEARLTVSECGGTKTMGYIADDIRKQ